MGQLNHSPLHPDRALELQAILANPGIGKCSLAEGRSMIGEKAPGAELEQIATITAPAPTVG